MVDKDHAEKFEEAKAGLKSNQSELEEATQTVATTGEEATAAKTVKQEKAEALQTAKKEAGCGCHHAARWIQDCPRNTETKVAISDFEA